MAFRSQETARVLMGLALAYTSAAASGLRRSGGGLQPAQGFSPAPRAAERVFNGVGAPEFRYEAIHEHLRKGRPGTLIIDAQGVAFQEAGKPKKHPHAWRWGWADIQQLELSPKSLRVLTYRDNRWKLGADREYRFDLSSGTFLDAYEFLKSRLDQRFVAALADGAFEPLWRIPVKHLTRFGGSQGELIVGRDRVVYDADKKSESRTWRYSDIENVSSSGPFQLTLTTYERALAHYGSLKGFNFQLREPLADSRYDELWRLVSGAKDLKFLNTYKETRQP